MPKLRLSTTVDEDLLRRARSLRPAATDASIVEAALEALLDRHRRAAVDEAYIRAYREHPIDETDAWGDLASFGDRAGAR